jgi:RNA polymerase sigma factor (sigma-70 family)
VSPLLLRRLSDELLGSRLASGEAAAFDELYRRYVHRLSAYGANLLGDAASGDDVAQSTLLKAYGALRDGRLPERIKPWLFRIAHNTAIDLVVRRRELPEGELPERATAGGEPVAGALVAALASLPDRQRRVYVLREVHGLRIDETAAELGLTASQVEQSLFAARNRLAEHLVFGDRLNCVAVQRLVAGPLDMDERRALKTHLRSCPDCRSAVGMRGRALGFLPVVSLDWLRNLLPGLVGGSAPVAAKVGVVVATASLAAGVPITVERTTQHHFAAVPQHVKPRATHASHPAVHTQFAALPVFHSTSPAAAHIATVVARDHGNDLTANVAENHGNDGATSGDHPASTGSDGSGDGSGDGGQNVPVTPALAPDAGVPPTITSSSGDGGDQPAATETTATTTVATDGSSSGDGSSGSDGSSGDGGTNNDSGSGGDGSSSDH